MRSTTFSREKIFHLPPSSQTDVPRVYSFNAIITHRSRGDNQEMYSQSDSQCANRSRAEQFPIHHKSSTSQHVFYCLDAVKDVHLAKQIRHGINEKHVSKSHLCT